MGECDPCPLPGLDGEVVDVRQHHTGDTCETDVTLQHRSETRHPDTTVVHTRREPTAACPCTVLGDLGCVPSVTAVRDDRLHIEVYLPDRTTLCAVVDSLREVCASVSLQRLGRVEETLPDGPSETVTVELTELTETQRETAVLAVDCGYYAQPRETSFAALAAELGVSKSALSQRLRAVEAKVTRAAFASR